MTPRLPTAAPRGAARTEQAPRARQVRVDALRLPATLTLPARARGLVVCAHGGTAEGGDGAASTPAPLCQEARLRDLARVLLQHRLATLFVDLLDPSEAQESGHLALLTERAIATLDWAAGHDDLAGLRAGLCATDVAAAAALVAATRRPARVAAVVGRSGRPDLAGAALARVAVPTLLIVGGQDPEALAFNRAAMRSLNCEKRLEVVPGATHCFDEPGALEAMAHLAGAWLAERLSTGHGRR